MKSFSVKVLNIVRQIPKGTVMTYKQVAEAAGSPNASRVVGSIMARNNNVSIPCHRVVRSDGSFGLYNGLLEKTKVELLRDEGYIEKQL